ncbi:hypothetical protein QR680_011615 [Steinernema hermaphroditum]|uniref:Transmembrane protein n=1 Tax=Steinernema hermaphroditum TaxID=289476 RepID=A0AA39LZ03_9BILA|nr:hypothetical protein QR680_011615 [Steinernema hermaphroditum]
MLRSPQSVRSLMPALYNTAAGRHRTFPPSREMPVRHYYPASVQNVGAALVDVSFLRKQMRKINFHGGNRSIYFFSAYLGCVGALTYYSLQQAVKKTNELAPAQLLMRRSDKNYRHPSVHGVDVSSY